MPSVELLGFVPCNHLFLPLLPSCSIHSAKIHKCAKCAGSSAFDIEGPLLASHHCFFKKVLRMDNDIEWKLEMDETYKVGRFATPLRVVRAVLGIFIFITTIGPRQMLDVDTRR
ncbi:unnamed protein product [Periconia digitata]|uniref:Uncharacterized protein n=1 Tax=Periconia digitata TaxID=1303443 RepID=A0A9W4UC29_9PLEO|nr:unnamed protein product [Periconia digitata]